MAYQFTANVSSWSNLSAAISTFATTTLGTYTEQYNDGVRMDSNPSGGTALCLTHTLTGMHYMFDSGPADDAAYGTWNGVTGESFMIGTMSTDHDKDKPLFEQVGTPHAGAVGANVASARQGLPGHNNLVFGSGCNLWLFGDTPAAGGEDYLFIVLEARSGVYAHWWTGQVNPILSEIVAPYGGFMGCGGPRNNSTLKDLWYPPFTVARDFQNQGQFYFPEGDEAGFINAPNKPGNMNNQACEANWITQGIATTMYENPSQTGLSGRSSLTNRTGISQSLVGVSTNVNSSILVAGNSGSIPGTSSLPHSAGHRFVPCGVIPGVGSTLMDAYVDQDEILVSSDTYKMFSAFRKDASALSESSPAGGDVTPNNLGNVDVRDSVIGSGLQGFAYKK